MESKETTASLAFGSASLKKCIKKIFTNVSTYNQPLAYPQEFLVLDTPRGADFYDLAWLRVTESKQERL